MAYKTAALLALAASGLATPLQSRTSEHSGEPVASGDVLHQKYYPPSADCWEYSVPVDVDTEINTFNLPDWKTDYDMLDFKQLLTSRASEISPDPYAGTANITASYTMAASFCTPKNKHNNKKTVILATHGIGPGREQFNPAYKPDQYSFVQYAISQGYSVFFYDRLGYGHSSPVSGFVNQSPLQSAVLVQLGELVKSGQYTGTLGKPDKLVAMGFSFGSLVTNLAVAAAPTLFDGVVFTGLNYNATEVNSNGLLREFLGRVASFADPVRFGALDPGYLTWATPFAHIDLYLKYPYYDLATASYGESVKQAFAIGEFLTLNVGILTGGDYTGPVLSILGTEDYILCDGNCAGINEEPGRTIWKKASNFSPVLHPNAGHNIYYQYNATAAYGIITDYLDAHL